MIKVCGKDTDGLFARIAASAFETLKLSGEAAVDLQFVGKKEIARLNYEFRGKKSATDVLSFPLLDEIKEFSRANYPLLTAETGEVLLGGIAICSAVAEENAAADGQDAKTEICFLFAHGLLHLLGFDHMAEEEAAIMKKMEKAILEKAEISFKN